MQLHNIKRKNKNKKPQYIGRGGKRGKTSGKGTKGQNVRAGRKKRPEMRDIIKRLPKLRGRGKNLNTPIKVKMTGVNLSSINKLFVAGEIVSPESLFQKKIIKKIGGKHPRVKILASGDITKKITVRNCFISAEAKKKIEKAGGKA
ncbi:MAG: 50S ribosomal protein L15 [Candidatus Zambryskibacteria bacterium CG_4_9_14_3_um_filter_40_16]|uniref:Large ribosomal subunit protein uL15 n=2 Tax=Candidatus Zambryskiibacteriota TaxID=1817925 RepID=A0A2H0K674_9BACT|nr:MAG: 50S ribosomal protein L15 [Candidatus Zambryskibacteria bacterium CG11_big_fil_rev_8_21_14_0_20_40_24]PJA33728.1 MAG: 50S ribosomal protein L15 [Candidatus Zambryskibacteria bacterium CG_4_9_14_3_um_filter_40_16]